MEPEILTIHNNILHLVENTIDHFSPENIIKSSFRRIKNTVLYQKTAWNLDYYKTVNILCLGKTAISSYKGISSIIKSDEANYIVYSHQSENLADNILSFTGDHPELTENNIKNSSQIVNQLSKLRKDDLLFVFLGGGSSALLEIPANNVSNNDLIKLYDELLKDEISIDKINLIRSIYSSVKNGKLLKYLNTSHIDVFLFSDVKDNKTEFIGSGPFLSFDFSDQYNELLNSKQHKRFLKRKYHFEQLKKVNHHLLASNSELITFLESKLKEKLSNYRITCQKNYISLEIDDFIAKISKEMKTLSSKTILLLGGEIFLSVNGDGKGGRNQELILRALKQIDFEKKFSLYAIVSDGKDGNSNASGAFLNSDIKNKVEAENLNLEPYLLENNSNELFNKIGNLIDIKSQTNLNDIFIVVKH